MRWPTSIITPLTEWHLWFAWYPIRVGEERIWLETVQRKGTWTDNPDWGMMAPYGGEPEGWWEWEYKL